MFEAEIEAHNLRAIETEPYKLWLLQGYAMTINIHLREE